MEISARHHLRNDEVQHLRAELDEHFGAEIRGETFEAVSFTSTDEEIVLVDGAPTILRLETGPVLTVQGANSFEPDKRIVVVDAGAVSFVSNGADIMRPGIVEADPEIEAGDAVLIAEETHGKVLAVGHARTDGADMIGEEGKVVDTVHYVGDEWFDFSP